MIARDISLVFDCPRWPACGCPDGTIADDCPGVSRPIGPPETAAAPPAAADSATGGLSPVASSPAGVSSPPAGVFVPRHPMQPIVLDGTVARFKANKIIAWLLESQRFTLNEIAMLSAEKHWSADDRMQLAQLIGYSVGGYSDLPYVTNESYEQAWQKFRMERIKHEPHP